MQVVFGGSSAWLRSHPRIWAVVRFVVAAFRYVCFFRWVVDFARWLIDTGGNIAESAFLLATVYVTINTVAHKLVAWALPGSIILTLNQVAVIAFSVLPELIIFAAIKVTFDHFKLAVATRRVDAWAWAIAYVLPTAVFLYLTIATISSFVSVEAISATAPQATGRMLVTRCLAGWSFGMLQMLFAKIGSEGYGHLFERLRAEIAALGETLRVRDESITGLQADIDTWQGRSANQERELIELRPLPGVVASRDAQIATLQSDLATVQEQIALKEQELIDARIALANQKVTRSQKSTFPQAHEKSTFATIADAKQERLKKHLRVAILSGEKVNYRKIAADASVSYNMVRRHAKTIIEELTQERGSQKLESVGA